MKELENQIAATAAMGGAVRAKFTPYSLSMLLHFHGSVSPFETEGSIAYVAALRTFQKEGLVWRDNSEHAELQPWRLTTYGEAWVEKILSTESPLPNSLAAGFARAEQFLEAEAASLADDGAHDE